MEEEILKRNHFITWGIFVGALTLLGLTISILYIDFGFFRRPDIIKDEHLKTFLLVLSVVFTGVVIRTVIRLLAQNLNYNYLKRFRQLPELGAYGESLSRFYSPEKPYEHFVLLLHGFTASPQEFEHLIRDLEKNKIPYFAPMMMGFGLDSTLILQNTRYQDWFRTALSYYDFLTTISKKVSIIGHSMGAILATYIAQERSVYRLVLSAPGLYSHPSDKKLKTALFIPVLSSLFIALIPYFPKFIRKGRKTISDTLNENNTTAQFQYMAVPIEAVRSVLLAQEHVDLTKIKKTDLLVIYGQHDITVDMDKCLHVLSKSKLAYETKCLKRTAHNVFEDFETDESCAIVIEFLQKTTPITL